MWKYIRYLTPTPLLILLSATITREHIRLFSGLYGFAEYRTVSTPLSNKIAFHFKQLPVLPSKKRYMVERFAPFSDIIALHKNSKILVYVPTIHMIQKLKEKVLDSATTSSHVYHSQLDAETAEKTLNIFNSLSASASATPILLSTDALKVGVNLTNIRVVIVLLQAHSPGDLIQKFCRANRQNDSSPSTAYYLYDAQAQHHSEQPQKMLRVINSAKCIRQLLSEEQFTKSADCRSSNLPLCAYCEVRSQARNRRKNTEV